VAVLGLVVQVELLVLVVQLLQLVQKEVVVARLSEVLTAQMELRVLLVVVVFQILQVQTELLAQVVCQEQAD